MILKWMKYNMHYAKRRSTAAARHYHQVQCTKINVKKVIIWNNEHIADQKMWVLVLLRLFISSYEVCNTAYAI